MTRSPRSILMLARLMRPCAMHSSFQSDGSPLPPVEMKSLVRDIVERITVAADRIEIRLSRAKIAAALEAGEASQRPDLDPVVLSIEAKLRRAGKGKRLVIENGAEAEVNAGLVEHDQRSLRDPKPAVVWIGRQHRGDERTPRNE